MANSYTSVVGVNHLNYFMKDYPSGIIVDTDFMWSDPLFRILRDRANQLDFRGGNLFEIEMQTTYSYAGTAMGERTSLPYAGEMGFIKMSLPMKQVIEPSGITQRALDFATGGDASWGKVVAKEIDQVKNLRFPWLMELCAMGDGTGRLARVVSSAHSSTSIVVTCDNTYVDFGWENVRFLKPGMWVEAYNAAGSPIEDTSDGGTGVTATAFKVTAVSFGDRANSTATSGTVTLTCTTDLDSGTGATYCFDNGAVLYLAGTRSKAAASGTLDSTDSTNKYEATNMEGSVDVSTSLPMGLVGIYQTNNSSYYYSDGSIDCTLDTFQGLARGTYSTLRPKIYNGSDINSGTQGTPADWDSSTITDAWNERYEETGGEIDLILLSSQLATCWDRKNAAGIQPTVDVARGNDWSVNIQGAQYAKPFRCPTGRLIPVVISRSIPKNVMYGITTKDLHWMTKGGGFGYFPWGENGGIWRFATGHRYPIYEAWYGGYTQLAAERCDRAFIIQDLADNVS